MEELLAKEGFAGLIIVLCLHLLFNIGKFVYHFFEKKRTDVERATEHKITKVDLTLQQLSDATRELRVQIGLLEAELKEVHKFKADSKKLFSAVKIMAGKRWPEVRKAMLEDELPHKG
jgi:hypothetical protein